LSCKDAPIRYTYPLPKNMIMKLNEIRKGLPDPKDKNFWNRLLADGWSHVETAMLETIEESKALFDKITTGNEGQPVLLSVDLSKQQVNVREANIAEFDYAARCKDHTLSVLVRYF